MKKLFLFLIPPFLAIIIFAGFLLLNKKDSGKGALQVKSIPKSKVYLDGKLIGETPFCKCEIAEMLKTGDYTIRLVPEEVIFEPFEAKIKISESVLTVVDRTFSKGTSSEAYILNLNKISDSKIMELLILSFPDDAKVFIDNNPSSQNTPLLLKNLTESDHEVKISKVGYKEKMINIRTVPGYKLTAIVYLGINPEFLNISQTPVSQIEGEKTATPAANIIGKVIIFETPTGFLRVREASSSAAKEIDKVYPKEIYNLINEKTGWFEIQLKNEKTGWISSRYAKKQ